MDLIGALMLAPVRMATLRDLGADAVALSAILGLVALLWVWAGGRQWWQERQTDKRRQRVMLSQWVGEPASPGSPGHPAFRDEMLERFDLLGDRLSRNEDLARRAWRHTSRHSALIDTWLIPRIRQIEARLNIPHQDPPTFIPDEYADRSTDE